MKHCLKGSGLEAQMFVFFLSSFLSSLLPPSPSSFLTVLWVMDLVLSQMDNVPLYPMVLVEMTQLFLQNKSSVGSWCHLLAGCLDLATCGLSAVTSHPATARLSSRVVWTSSLGGSVPREKVEAPRLLNSKALPPEHAMGQGHSKSHLSQWDGH